MSHDTHGPRHSVHAGPTRRQAIEKKIKNIFSKKTVLSLGKRLVQQSKSFKGNPRGTVLEGLRVALVAAFLLTVLGIVLIVMGLVLYVVVPGTLWLALQAVKILVFIFRGDPAQIEESVRDFLGDWDWLLWSF